LSARVPRVRAGLLTADYISPYRLTRNLFTVPTLSDVGLGLVVQRKDNRYSLDCLGSAMQPSIARPHHCPPAAYVQSVRPPSLIPNRVLSGLRASAHVPRRNHPQTR
jgi:hypothetical protein